MDCDEIVVAGSGLINNSRPCEVCDLVGISALGLVELEYEDPEDSWGGARGGTEAGETVFSEGSGFTTMALSGVSSPGSRLTGRVGSVAFGESIAMIDYWPIGKSDLQPNMLFPSTRRT